MTTYNYGYAIQIRAEEWAELRWRQDFCELSDEQQRLIYEEAMVAYAEGTVIAVGEKLTKLTIVTMSQPRNDAAEAKNASTSSYDAGV